MSFKRITDNHLAGDTLERIYDEIRMRDAEDHPLAYIEHGNLRIEFRCAYLRENHVEVDARIYVRKQKNPCCNRTPRR